MKPSSLGYLGKIEKRNHCWPIGLQNFVRIKVRTVFDGLKNSLHTFEKKIEFNSKMTSIGVLCVLMQEYTAAYIISNYT